MGSSINIALPTIALEFKANAILLGWIPTVYLLSLAVFLVPFGRIADIYGRKRVFTYGIIIFTISSLVAGFSISTGMLLLLRVFQGLGAAMIFGNVAAIIASLFPPGERGRALGISVTGVFLGLFLGPVLGGFLTQNLGWRSIFFLNVVLGLLSTLAVLRLRGEWTEAQGEKFDLPGSLVLGMSLVSLMYGLSELPTLHGFFLILGGLLGLVLFFSLYHDKTLLVSFNGRSFDAPFIRRRMKHHHLDYPDPAHHLDLLYPARYNWKSQLPNCQLQTLERYLFDLERVDDVPGHLVPDYYRTYLHEGNIGPLVPILEHNRMDVVTLIRLLSLIQQDI